MSIVFFFLFILIYGLSLVFILNTISDCKFYGIRRNLINVVFCIILVPALILISVIPYTTVSHTLTEELPFHGTIEITLKDEDAFADKAFTKVEKFISKYISKQDVDIYLERMQNTYFIYIKNNKGEIIDYYYDPDEINVYLLLRDSTLLE